MSREKNSFRIDIYGNHPWQTGQADTLRQAVMFDF